MVIVVILAGVALLRRQKWPWMLVGGVVMFFAAAVPTSAVGFWVSNLGEVALSLGLVLTEGYLQGVVDPVKSGHEAVEPQLEV